MFPSIRGIVARPLPSLKKKTGKNPIKLPRFHAISPVPQFDKPSTQKPSHSIIQKKRSCFLMSPVCKNALPTGASCHLCMIAPPLYVNPHTCESQQSHCFIRRRRSCRRPSTLPLRSWIHLAAALAQRPLMPRPLFPSALSPWPWA